MRKSHWQKWEPFDGFPNKISLECLLQNKNGLKIQFESYDEKKIDIVFGYSALTLKVTDEGDMLKSINYWSQEYGNDFFTWPVYKSTNSSFIKWFNKESCGKFADVTIEHYLFITEDDIVEVISATPPQINIY
ncbi:hypothetical protein [Pontibacillus sp. HMF3514]|uniref:hypothetical protein n=1 Tax=Pontibacillus sp. HMF3514 TaxID=2692425 RepID=UPI00131FEF2B|nr:hypothetical protein [Pontibacillus sp. HMF3514]QHE50866.1 hypothetical protein GS400_01885 [Pontibacillus sp. HMF3514]